MGQPQRICIFYQWERYSGSFREVFGLFSLPFPIEIRYHVDHSPIRFKNIPQRDCGLNLLIKASCGVSPIFKLSAPWILLLYQSTNSSAVSNLFLCFLYSLIHRSILPLVWIIPS